MEFDMRTFRKKSKPRVEVEYHNPLSVTSGVAIFSGIA